MAIHISTLSAPTSNPLDVVEEVIISNDWSYERFSEEELGVEISGKWCNHRFVFMWKNEWESLHFTCYMDVKVPKARIKDACELIIKANQKGFTSLRPCNKERISYGTKCLSTHRKKGPRSTSRYVHRGLLVLLSFVLRTKRNQPLLNPSCSSFLTP